MPVNCDEAHSNAKAIHNFHRFVHTLEWCSTTTVHRERDHIPVAVDDTPQASEQDIGAAATDERTVRGSATRPIACASRCDTPRGYPRATPDNPGDIFCLSGLPSFETAR
jgi:hypothetical protein